MSLADYLAKNYLTADTKSKKSKKKKRKIDEGNIVEVNDDLTGWENKPDVDDEDHYDDEGMDNVEVSHLSPVQARWKKVKKHEPSEHVKYIVKGGENADEPESSTGLMSSGARAGLQTAAQVQRDIDRKQKAELLAAAESYKTRDESTIYRDASGRVVDISVRVAEAEKRKQDDLEKKKRQQVLNQGLVQAANANLENEKLKAMKDTSLSRYAGDEELNQQLKDKDLFEDPAVSFLTKKKKKSRSIRQSTSVTGLPVYTGGYAPNRFNIAPGYRWDGVDRSNGFESLWFQKQNERKEKQQLSYTMSYDI